MHQCSQRNRRWSLATLFFFFLSFLNVATAAPLSDGHVKANALAARADSDKDPRVDYNRPQITEQEYVDYLRNNYPETDKYLFYTGGAEKQLTDFKAANPGYLYYQDFFDAWESAPYRETFPPIYEQGVDGPQTEKWRLDDGDASSRAIARVATGNAVVFGGSEYWKYDTFFKSQEVPILKQRMADASSGLTGIDHMAKDTTDRSAVMATEDADGKWTYNDGYSDADKNDSIQDGTGDGAASDSDPCKRAAGPGCNSQAESKPSTDTSGNKTPYGNPADQTNNVGDSSSDPSKPRPAPEAPKIPRPAAQDPKVPKLPIRPPRKG